MGWCNEHGQYQDLTTPGCPNPAHKSPVPVFRFFEPTSGVPFKCPCCDGMGKRSRPPYVAGDMDSWVADGAGPYPCNACNGTGLVWSKQGGA